MSVECRFFEEHPMEYLQASTSQILGVCTGLLAASAVASSDSLTALIPLAVQTVCIAFRLGARVSRVGHQLEASRSEDQTWSTIILGIGSEAAELELKDFNQNQVSDSERLLNFLLIGSGSGRVK